MLAHAANRVFRSLTVAIESEDDEVASLRYADHAHEFFDTIKAQKSTFKDIICKLLQVQAYRIVP